MIRRTLLAAMLLLAITGCTGAGSGVLDAGHDAVQLVGATPSLDPAFDRIDTMTDCAALEHEMDLATRRMHVLEVNSPEWLFQQDLQWAAFHRWGAICSPKS